MPVAPGKPGGPVGPVGEESLDAPVIPVWSPLASGTPAGQDNGS